LKPLAITAFASAKRQPAIAAVLSISMILLLQWQLNITTFHFDAELYWLLAILPERVPLEISMRGYFFPWVMGRISYALHGLGLTPLGAFKGFASITYGIALCLLLPATYRRLANGQVTLVRRLGIVAALVFVFPGVLVYPLSDLPAILFMWLCVYCLLCSRDRLAAGQGWGGWPVAWAVLAGAAGAAAYNTRTIYLFSVAVLLLAMVLQFRGHRRFVLYFMFGFTLISLPQLQANLKNHQIMSINPTVKFGQRSIFTQQLLWGLTVQRYETAIVADAPTLGLIYGDPAGKLLEAKIVAAAHPLSNGQTTANGAIDSVTDFLKIAVLYPFDFAALYARHFFNGLDVRDGHMYLTEPSAPKNFTGFACFAMVLVCSLAIVAGRKSAAAARVAGTAAAQPRYNALYTLALVITSIAAVPGAIETRFMLPLLLYLWVAAAGHWSNRAMWSQLRTHPIIYGFVAIATCSVFIVITHSTMTNLLTPWTRN
jgi:hypothetical protein